MLDEVRQITSQRSSTSTIQPSVGAVVLEDHMAPTAPVEADSEGHEEERVQAAIQQL